MRRLSCCEVSLESLSCLVKSEMRAAWAEYLDSYSVFIWFNCFWRLSIALSAVTVDGVAGIKVVIALAGALGWAVVGGGLLRALGVEDDGRAGP